jgi:sterol desaturase/sphingolipid hydroxylase (fatty acid hydroxylase superfamily)
MMYVVYTGKFKIFERERSKGHPDEQWPWESMKPEEWSKLLKRSLMFNAFNSLISNPFVNYMAMLSGKPVFHSIDIDSMPSPLVFAAQIMFCMLIEDMVFYCSHRTLH